MARWSGEFGVDGRPAAADQLCESGSNVDAGWGSGAGAGAGSGSDKGAGAGAGGGGSRALRFRAIWPVIRAAGLVPWTFAFAVLFLAASLVVAATEPAIGGFGNAAWLMFQVVTTIGLGDFTCASVVGRAAAIVLSVYSVFFLALITGAVVSYCGERMSARRDASVAHFLDQLEHLPELSRDELEQLSEKVRRFKG